MKAEEMALLGRAQLALERALEYKSLTGGARGLVADALKDVLAALAWDDDEPCAPSGDDD